MSWEDSVFIIVGVAILALTAIPIYIVITELDDAVQNNIDPPQGFKDQSTKLQQGFPMMWQTWFLFFFGMSWLVTLILAFRIDSNPAWFAVSFVFMLAIIFVGLYAANAYDDAIRSQFVEAEAFPILTLVLQNFGKLSVIMVFTVGFALYAKARIT